VKLFTLSQTQKSPVRTGLSVMLSAAKNLTEHATRPVQIETTRGIAAPPSASGSLVEIDQGITGCIPLSLSAARWAAAAAVKITRLSASRLSTKTPNRMHGPRAAQMISPDHSTGTLHQSRQPILSNA
jgi:hypothetical protein